MSRTRSLVVLLCLVRGQSGQEPLHGCFQCYHRVPKNCPVVIIVTFVELHQATPGHTIEPVEPNLPDLMSCSSSQLSTPPGVTRSSSSYTVSRPGIPVLFPAPSTSAHHQQPPPSKRGPRSCSVSPSHHHKLLVASWAETRSDAGTPIHPSQSYPPTHS